MKSLFEDNREASILAYMRKSQVTDIHALATQLGVSTRTIRNDVKTINTRLGEAGTLDLDQSRLSLRIFNTDEFHRLYTTILNTDDLLNSTSTRLDYIFGRLMRSKDPVLSDELAYEMNIGRSTLVKDITKLRENIEYRDLSIEGLTSKGLVLRGKELNIRRYVLENNYDVIYRDFPLDTEVQDLIDKGFENQPFDHKVKATFLRYVTLMLDRFMNGHELGHLKDKYYNLTADAAFSFVDRLLNQLVSLLHIELPIEEKIFVFLSIAGMHKPDKSEQLSQIELDSSMDELLNEILDAVYQETDISIDMGEYRLEFLYHLMFCVNRLRYKVHIDNPMAHDVRAKYPLASRIADIAGRIIAQKYGLEVSVEELGFLTIYFSVCIVDLFEGDTKSYAIVCGAGRATARLIEAQLRRIIDSSDRVTIVADDELLPTVLDRFDVVLTTIDLPVKTTATVIYIDEIFNEEELRSRIQKLRYLPREVNSLIDDNWFVMASILDKRQFFVLEDVLSYEQARDTMVAELVSQQLVDEAFAQRLVDREKTGALLIEDGVVIPHTTNKADTSRMVLALGVFPEPIKYLHHEISLIVMMALPEETENEELLVRVYEELLSLMNDRELLERLKGVRTFAQLMHVLYKRW